MPLQQHGSETSASQYSNTLTSHLKKWALVLKNYIKRAVDHQNCLAAVEEFFGEHEMLWPALVKALMTLYQLEVLVEETILGWFSQSAPTEKGRSIRKHHGLQKFIKWLEEAEVESSEEEN
ncbi:translation initiation factor eIF-2B subunit epsilon [Rhincodon typus]|uniref:translation initiation factor eIF-2B subunit epsilon n=1 Tax=Rhincodon typus TaxID=259920 RepID=UPI002030DA70|nr:translation initiation factor eIF-2B subunit epsilon [Rhincodon typus]